MLQKKRRWCAIERFCLKIGLPDCLLNSDKNSIGLLRVVLRGASPPPFSALFWCNFRAFPIWAAMLKLSRAAKREELAKGENGKWSVSEAFSGLVPLYCCCRHSTGLSGKPIFSQNASIAYQRLFLACRMRNLSFFVRAGLIKKASPQVLCLRTAFFSS